MKADAEERAADNQDAEKKADNGGSFISVGVIIYAVNDQPPLELQQQDMINVVQGIMAVIDENHDKEEKNDNDNDDEFADEDDDDESAHVTHAAKPATPSSLTTG